MHLVSEPHCFKGIHDAAGKVIAGNREKGVKERVWTISDVSQHYDYNSATMIKPKNERINMDFSFSSYYHVLYKKPDFINLEAAPVVGTESSVAEVGTCARPSGSGKRPELQAIL